MDRQARRVRNVWIERYNDGEWSFRFSETMENIREELYDLADSMSHSPSRAERILRRMIEKEAPYAFDAYHQLAFILWYGRKDSKEAFAVLKDGLSKAEELFPEKFKLGRSQLPWGILENRPFLRMYESIGSRYLELGMLKQATEIFENIVTMNPDDNQGVRDTLCSCYFRRADPEAVLRLCGMYSDDGMEAIQYGRVLALLKLWRTDDAEKALEGALGSGENIAVEIMRKKHKRLKPEDELRPVECGSRFEAELYWMHFGKYWEETRGAVEFVRNIASRPASDKARSVVKN